MPVADTSEWPRRGDVTVEIVERGLCIGCGVCVAACSSDRLQMSAAHGGAQVPRLDGERCDIACGTCLAVCPFWPGNPDEDAIASALFGTCEHTEGVGFHREIMAAYSADDVEHLSGSSGGIGTLIGRSVLETGLADAIILANGHGQDRDAYAICRDPRCVADYAGSRYAPLSLAETLREIRSTGEKAVVMAVPCVAKAIRLLCDRVPAYRASIVGIVGLACGHTKRPDFWSFIAQRAGMDAARVRVARYRIKRENRLASDFALSLESLDDKNRATPITLSWLEDVAEFWSHKWFTMTACLYCDDMMAECADVALMDAWLPRYVSDWRGTTLVVTRSALMDAALEPGSGRLVRESVAPQQALQSQKDALAWKRQGLALRVRRSTPWGRALPGWKRVDGSGGSLASERLRWRIDAWIADRTARYTLPMTPESMQSARVLLVTARIVDKVSAVLRRLGA